MSIRHCEVNEQLELCLRPFSNWKWATPIWHFTSLRFSIDFSKSTLALSCKQNWGIFYELRPLAEPCKFKGETQPTQFANRRGKHTFTAIHQTYCSTKRWVCAIPTQPLGKTEKGGRCRINRYVNSRGRQTRERTRAVRRMYARRHVAHFPMAIFTECSVFTYRRPTHPYLHLPGMLCLKLSPCGSFFWMFCHDNPSKHIFRCHNRNTMICFSK